MVRDPDLIEAARQGDEAALRRLLQESRQAVQRLADKHCVSRADAEDAAQETIWLVYRRIGALRTVESYSAWLLTIVRRECQRLMRRIRSETELPEADDPCFAYHTHVDLQADLVAAVKSLPEKYREAIVLHDFEEFSVAEIASALRLSQGAVKSRISRGRRMVRQHLEQ